MQDMFKLGYKKLNNGYLNSPFVIEYDPRSKELDLTMKTIMRKKGFETSDDKIIV